jgi:hypothetical protein
MVAFWGNLMVDMLPKHVILNVGLSETGPIKSFKNY